MGNLFVIIIVTTMMIDDNDQYDDSDLNTMIIILSFINLNSF